MSAVDFLRRRLHVRETVADVRGQLLVGTPKSDAGRRTVPLTSALTERLAQLVKGRGLAVDAFVFGEQGEPLRHSAFYLSEFKPAVLRAGLNPATRFHDLRHTFASLMIAEDVHPKRLSTWMGHTTVALTMDRYGHLYEDDDAPVALESLCLPSPPAQLRSI